jgi:hypothetical protein
MNDETTIPALQKTLTQAVLSSGDGEEAITAAVKNLRARANGQDEHDLPLKQAMAAALDEGLRHATNTGNFLTLLSLAATDEQGTALEGIANARNLGLDERLMAASRNFLEKVELLTDRVAAAKREDVETVLAQTAGVCDPAIFPSLLARTSDPKKIEQGLADAASGSAGNFAADNIRAMLGKHPVSDETLFKAIEISVSTGSGAPFEALAEQAKRQNPALLNQETEDGRTLFDKVIPNRSLNLQLRQNMIEKLLEAGVKPPATIGGIDTIDAMEMESIPHYWRGLVEAAMDKDPDRIPHRYRDIAPRAKPGPARDPRTETETGTAERER